MPLRRLFLLFLSLSLLSADHTPLHLGEKLHGEVLYSDQIASKNFTNYYTLTVPNKIQNEDLTIIVKPRTPQGDPDIFISRINDYPNNIDNSEIVCSSFGLDVCTVANGWIEDNSTFFIGITCYSDCQYSLYAEYSDEIRMQLGQELLLKFHKTAAIIAKIYIPPDDSIDQLIIYANLLNEQEVNETFHIYVNEGNEIPSSNYYDYMSKDIWFDGKGVSINRFVNTSIFKSTPRPLQTGVNYSVLIEAGKNSVIKVSADAFPKIRPISLYQEIHDIVEYHDIQIYEFNVTEQEYNEIVKGPLIFELRVFSGNPDIYVHFDTLPDSLSGYKWFSSEDGNEALTLSVQEREDVKASNRKFYVAIYGSSDAAYILDVYHTSKNNDFLMFGETMTGTVLNNELLNFRLNIYGSGTVNLTLDLVSETGNADLFVKQCKSIEKNKCKITMEEVMNKKQLSQDDSFFFIYSYNYGGKDSLKFLFNQSDCRIQVYTENFGQIDICTYQVGVYGNSTTTSVSHYSLLAKHAQKHTKLSEGVSFRSNLEIREVDYYKFTLLNASDILSVTIMATSIAGEITVYASKTERFPGRATSFDLASYFEIDVCKFTLDNTANLNGNYYIAVEGFSAADYQITVLLKHKSDSKNINFIKLIEAQAVKISVKDSTDQYYFKLKVPKNDSIPNQQVFLHLRAISGHFNAFITTSNELAPSSQNFEYTMKEGYLVLQPNSSTNYYYIMVNLKEGSAYKNPQFGLMFTTSQSIIAVGFNSYNEYIGELESRFYKLSYDSNEEEIIITKTVYNSNNTALSLYVSLDETVIYPSSSQFTHRLNKEQSTLTLKREDIMMFCPYRKKMSQNCRIYIGVEAKENLYFSLLFAQNKVPILLYDDVVTEIPMLRDHEFQNFYYFVPNNSTVTLFVDSLYVNLRTYVNIQALSNLERSSWILPNELSHEYSYNSSYYIPSTIVLKHEYFTKKNCDSTIYGCLLLISIEKEGVDSYLSNNNIKIVVSSHLTRLQEGKPFISYVEKHTIKYFSFHVSQKDCVILISLTPLGDGDPDLIISKGDDTYPTLENYDWISTSYKSEELQIFRNSSEKVKETMEGNYIIGVYGFSNCTFTITVTFAKHKIIYLRPGYPHQYQFKAGDEVFFEYYNFDSGFRAILSESYGDSELIINPLNYTQDFIEQLPSYSNYKWTTEYSGRGIAYIRESDPEFCRYCPYIFRLILKEDSKGVIMISSENQPIHMQGGSRMNDFVEKNESITYYYQANTESVEFDFMLYSGDVELYFSKSEKVAIENSYQKYVKSNFTSSNRLSIRLGRGYNLLPYELESGSHSEENNLYRHSVLVRGLKNSNYSISFTSKAQTKILRFGVSDFASIIPEESQHYFFYNRDIKSINILVSLFDQNSGQNSDINIVYPKIKIAQKVNNKTEEVIPSEKITNIDSIFLKLSGTSSFYNIEISNPDNQSNVTYSLVINTDEVNLITPGSQTMKLLKMGELDKFELYSPGNRKVFIEILECFGKVQLKGTQNFQHVAQNTYDWDFILHNENNHILAFYEVSQGPVFVGIEAVQGYQPLIENSTALDEAFYIMKAHLLPPKGIILQESYFAGEGGILNWKKSGDPNGVMNFFLIFFIHCF